MSKILNKTENWKGHSFAEVESFIKQGIGITPFVICKTAGDVATKEITIENFILTKDSTIVVEFLNAFSAAKPELSINEGTAYPIFYFNNPVDAEKVLSRAILTMVFDGEAFNIVSIERPATIPIPSDAVDLGLPSGILWATKNIGAENPEDAGLYFSWGNIDGHAGDSGYDFGSYYDWDPYGGADGQGGWLEQGYGLTPGSELTGDIAVSASYDAARANLGKPWRMPTKTEFEELYDNCNSAWTQVNSVNGRLFTSKNNGNTVFFPAAGYVDGSTLNDFGSFGYYWSSSLFSRQNGYFLDFFSGGVGPQFDSSRSFGYSVRPVQ